MCQCESVNVGCSEVGVCQCESVNVGYVAMLACVSVNLLM